MKWVQCEDGDWVNLDYIYRAYIDGPYVQGDSPVWQVSIDVERVMCSLILRGGFKTEDEAQAWLDCWIEGNID